MALKNIKKREPKTCAQPKPSSLPAPATSADDGAIMVSAGKYARNMVMAAFEQIGGLPRLVEEADADPKWFYDKLFSKTITKEVEIDRKDDVEDLLDALDADFEEVTDVESERV